MKFDTRCGACRTDLAEPRLGFSFDVVDPSSLLGSRTLCPVCEWWLEWRVDPCSTSKHDLHDITTCCDCAIVAARAG